MKNVTSQNNITGDRIKELREDKKLTQVELASILSISREALANFETRRGITEDRLDNIADYFDTTVEYLLGETNVKCNDNPDYQLIGKYTGLTDKAIEVLGELKKYAPNIIDTINYLIEQEELLPISSFSSNEDISEEKAFENFDKLNDYWDEIHFPILSKISNYYNVEVPKETLCITNNGIKNKKDFKNRYEMMKETKATISAKTLSDAGLLKEIESQIKNSKDTKNDKSKLKKQNEQLKKYIENCNKISYKSKGADKK